MRQIARGRKLGRSVGAVAGLAILLVTGQSVKAQSPGALRTSATVALVRFLLADSTTGLLGASPESLLVDIGAAASEMSELTRDSSEQRLGVRLSITQERDCGTGISLTDVAARAECVLREYQHYVEIGSVEIRDDTARVTVWVAHRALAKPQSRGVRESVATSVGMAVGRPSHKAVTMSFRTYQAQLSSGDNGEWSVNRLIVPKPVRRLASPDSTAGPS